MSRRWRIFWQDLRVRSARRVVAIVSLTLLGGALLWARGSLPAWASAGGRFWWPSARPRSGPPGRCRRRPENDILLTRDGLFDESGRVLAAMEDIESVDRGVFAVQAVERFSW